MMEHLRAEAAKYGLKFNIEKTKMLTTADAKKHGPVSIEGESIELIDQKWSERYLGRKLCLGEYHQAELDNRMQGAWAAFTNYSAVFRSRSYSFPLKAKLFENVVSPVALYVAASWTLTK